MEYMSATVVTTGLVTIHGFYIIKNVMAANLKFTPLSYMNLEGKGKAALSMVKTMKKIKHMTHNTVSSAGRLEETAEN